MGFLITMFNFFLYIIIFIMFFLIVLYFIIISNSQNWLYDLKNKLKIGLGNKSYKNFEKDESNNNDDDKDNPIQNL